MIISVERNRYETDQKLLALAAVVSPSLGCFSFGAVDMAHAGNHSNRADHGTMQVVKSPTYGCIGAWFMLPREEGYCIKVEDTSAVTSVELDKNLPYTMWSCQTAIIDAHVIEGHVPFPAIAKLLKARSDTNWIAVPGMPGGSPAMENDPTAQYDMLAFSDDASESKFFPRPVRE